MKRINFAVNLEADLQAYESDNAKVDNGIMSLEAMISTQDILMESNGALDATAWRLASNSMECFARLGRVGNPGAKTIASLESHNGKYQVTQATLEGIASGVKNVFNAIIDAIKKAIDWMGGLIKKLFSREKDHVEFSIRLNTKKDEVKEIIKEREKNPPKAKAAEATAPGKTASAPAPVQTQPPLPRDHDGWLTKVEIHTGNIVRGLTTSKGMLKAGDIHQYVTEIAKVFRMQDENVKQAMNLAVRGDAGTGFYASPFSPCHDASVVKKLTHDKNSEILTSLEFPGGEYLFTRAPKIMKQYSGNSQELLDESDRFVEGLSIGKTTSDNIPDYTKYKFLTDPTMTNVESLLTLINFLSNALSTHASKLEGIQQSKRHFIKDFEARVLKHDAQNNGSDESRAERDDLMYHLKYFKKIMDQPAVLYYAQCEKIITNLEHLAMYVLDFNQRDGHVPQSKR